MYRVATFDNGQWINHEEFYTDLEVRILARRLMLYFEAYGYTFGLRAELVSEE